MRSQSLIFASALVLSGCASQSSTGPSQTFPVKQGARGGGGSPAIVTPAATEAGRIASVNPSARFVVITYPVGTLPGIERRLNVYRNGLKVAEVKVTGPTEDINTVADIVAGECRVGDEVRED